MDELGEWCFEFRVAARPIRRAVIDGLLDEVIRWAEARRLGIGGGYRAATAEVSGAAGAWAFHFGLCVTEDGRVIPRREASDLWAVVGAWCTRHGFTYTGGFHPFPPADEDVAAGPSRHTQCGEGQS